MSSEGAVYTIKEFQFTPLREGRHAESHPVHRVCDFNSRPSARGDMRLCRMRTNYILFQFTPLREGRHARTEGVENGGYFNSRPSARGDCKGQRAGVPRSNFNSRPSARGDGNWVRKIKTIDISIHAPPRGATFPFTNFHEQNLISIHAPPRGATFADCVFRVLKKIFQFTPLREGRLSSRVVVSLIVHFNSRPSARGDGH